MIRSRFFRAAIVALPLVYSVAAARIVVAQPAVMTEEQKAQAIALYNEGAAAYAAKDYPLAIEKFRGAYNLSKNPLLLYNAAVAYKDNGDKENAVKFYRKFLRDAPPEAAQRADADKAAGELEDELFAASSTGTATKPPPTTVEPPVTGDPVTPATVTIKPPGTYKDTDFEHMLVDEAPPGKPLDLTASAPVDSGWQVTLYYRTAGDEGFTGKLMKPRYKELVGRIPANKMAGSSMQYYIDVKDTTGTLVTRIGKPSSPNVIFLDAAASPRFYPDWVDDTVGTTGGGTVRKPGPDQENPFGGGSVGNPEQPDTTGGGFLDVGSTKFKYAKWGTTGLTAALAGLSVLFYLRASNSNDTLEGEAELSNSETCPSGPPCRDFDPFLQDAQASGQSAETWSKVSLVGGVAFAGLAGYLWYKQLTHKKAASGPATAAPSDGGMTFVAVPSIAADAIGGAALLTF